MVFVKNPSRIQDLVTPFNEKKVVQDQLFLDYGIFIYWGLPYDLIAAFLLIYAYVKEKNRSRKKGYLQTSIILVPTIVAAAYINIMTKVIYVYPEGDYMYLLPYFIMYSFVVYLIFAFREGILGVRIKLEKQIHENAILTSATITAMLNHSIKNKINYSTLTIENAIGKVNNNDELINDLKSVLTSNHEIMLMVRKIQNAIDFELVPEPCTLKSILESSLENTAAFFENNNMKCIAHYSCKAHVECDSVHMKEVFINIIKNAIESMEPRKGILEVSLFETKKRYFIQFEDNGQGISKEEMKQIFNPFFSTKRSPNNYGLGLTYCYLVLDKHRANIRVESQEGRTSFILGFPKYKHA